MTEQFGLKKENMEQNLEVECTWRGSVLSELCLNIGKLQHPPVQPTQNHTVLFQLPVMTGEQLKPYPSRAVDVWDKDHVRMPHSFHSLYPITETELQRRWELIQQALTRSILSSQQLEEAILYYNSKYSTRWNFDALHEFFSEILEEEETSHFFSNILPKIIQLALSLPDLITGGIPLLRRRRTHSISLSQQQISSLLANAFLCTFPRRNTNKRQSEYHSYPDINFNRLFIGQNSTPSLQEKLKCLVNYFRRACTEVPDGVLTYSRHYLSSNQIPSWGQENVHLPKLHVSEVGTIEDQGRGMLQMDFANKYVGGGVLGRGSLQEEIRFVICPELIAARLFTECLDDTEALIITGAERYSNYNGYASSFQWAGDFRDQTPRDSFRRRYCTLVAVDAVHFQNPNAQYSQSNINRELNKAYAGFSWGTHSGSNTSIATGNWGCGSFKGDVYLKALLQLMAAGKAGRDVAYFTFGDLELRDRLADMHGFLTNKKVTVGQLWNLICRYGEVSKRTDLFNYLHRTINNNTGIYSGFGMKQEESANCSSNQKEKQSEDNEDTWFLSSQDIEAALETEEKTETPQKDAKCTFVGRKSYSVSSDLCAQRQAESWTSLNETKKDFHKSKSVNKIESDPSPERQRTGPLKRKITDYFSTSSKS